MRVGGPQVFGEYAFTSNEPYSSTASRFVDVSITQTLEAAPRLRYPRASTSQSRRSERDSILNKEAKTNKNKQQTKSNKN